jgi:hypothetical protein
MSVEQVSEDLDGLHWFKSSHSGSDGGDCVEVATVPGAVRVRDSKDKERASLRVSEVGWAAFVAYARG